MSYTIPMDKDQFEEALSRTLNEVLNSKRTISDEQHIQDHKSWQELSPFLRQWVKDKKKNEERWEKFRMSIIGSIALILVSGLVWVGKLVWNAVHT